MMERLEGPLTELIAAEREEVDAIPKSPDAAWAGIAAALQPPPPPSGGGGTEAAGTSAAKTSLLKIVAAVVVGTSIAAGAWAFQEAPAHTPAPRVKAPAVVAATGVERPPLPNIDAAPVSAMPPARPVPRVEPRSAARTARRTAPQPGLAEELALVDSIRRDVAAGRFSEALSLAKKHRDTFAKGSLIADRLDLEAAARCGRGSLEAGRRLADQKAKRWPRAPMSDRLRTLCKLDNQ